MKSVTGDWVQEHVEWLWGFRLYDFQLEDVLKTLHGGVYSFMYPTDYGKSMEIEIDTVLSLIRDHNSREIIIKINDSAAHECADELALKLQKASSRYPGVEPLVQWRNERPHGTSRGFWLKGAEFLEGRNINRSVRCYGLGSNDLQGKRGRTKIDDILTEKEARSEAMRDQVEARMDSVLRTLEADGLTDGAGLWAMYGTPAYEGSVYDEIPARLREAGIPHEVVKRPAYKADGTPLMPSNAAKLAVHKATMTKAAFAVAYDLKPFGTKRPTNDQVEVLVKHRGMPIPRNAQEFRDWLVDDLLRHVTQDRGEVFRILTDLHFYVGWDPATTGVSAQAVYAKLGRHTWVTRAHLGIGIDTYDQAVVVGRFMQEFPDALVVLENNAEQKAFQDVFENLYPDYTVVPHGTYRNKNHGPISIPAMVQEMIEGYFHIPWQDEALSEERFGDLIDEIKKYSLASHPHLIPAIWFGWHWANKANGGDVDDRIPAGEASRVDVAPPRVPAIMPSTYAALESEQDTIKQRSREAWGRRHEAFR